MTCRVALWKQQSNKEKWQKKEGKKTKQERRQESKIDEKKEIERERQRERERDKETENQSGRDCTIRRITFSGDLFCFLCGWGSRTKHKKVHFSYY